MGENELGHRSCGEHISIELWSRWFVSISDWKTHCCTHSVVQCWRNRVQKKDDKISIWDLMVVS